MYESKLIADSELANKYLDIALKYEKFGEFLGGIPIFELTTIGPMGERIFSVAHVVGAVYDKYKEEPESNLDKKMYEEIKRILETSPYERFVLHLLEVIEYQMDCEKKKIAPFKIDCVDLLKDVKDNINRNKIRYTKKSDLYGENGIWPSLEMHNTRLSSYGHRIM